DFPQYWAITQINLGIAYSGKITGNRAENIDAAIASFQRTLEVYTREDFPRDWAMTQNNLGIAYKDKITGNRAENIDVAISCFRLALEFLTPITLPLDCLKSGRNLGDLAFKEGLWEIAIEGYEAAINAVEKSRSWSTTDASRQQILAESIDVYQNIIQACINNGNLEKVIAYADRSRSKRLVDLMASNDLYAGGEIPPQVQAYLQQYDKLQAKIDTERKRLQSDSDSSKQKTDKTTVALTRTALEAATATIENLEAQKQQVWEQMRRLDPVLAGEIEVKPLDFATIQQLTDTPQTAILNFFTTDNDTHIFIIYKDKSPQLHTCTGFGYQTLRDLVVDEWLNPYLNKKIDGIWYVKISELLQQLAEKLQIKTLVQTYLSGIEELIIIPHLYWHQIPFAALRLIVPIQVNSQPPENRSSGTIRQAIETFTRLGEGKKTLSGTLPTDTEIVSTQYLGDRFRIRYVPSSQILQYCQQRPPLSQINYGTVEDADGTLQGAVFEGAKIAMLCNIPQSQRLIGKTQATVNNYRKLANQVQVLHSSHHAQSRLDKPLESILKLANGNITLGQIMSPGFRLPNLFDVFLSCCETNLGISGITDDILSLSTGFLCAGARSVVSTLWAVDDLATALFSIYYYQYRQQGKNRPEALQKAQIDLRNLKMGNLKADLEREFESVNKARVETKERLNRIDRSSEKYQQLQED
ncbi:MAG: CHAT domain-containing protein, partial [Microcoleus sp.]